MFFMIKYVNYRCEYTIFFIDKKISFLMTSIRKGKIFEDVQTVSDGKGNQMVCRLYKSTLLYPSFRICSISANRLSVVAAFFTPNT